MDQEILLESQIEDAPLLIERLVEDGFPVLAAFWAMKVDGYRWDLHLVTPAINERGLGASYRAVNETIRAMPPIRIGDPVVKLIRPSDPLARGVLDELKEFPDAKPTRLGASRIGDVYVDGSYIYPPIASMLGRPA